MTQESSKSLSILTTVEQEDQIEVSKLQATACQNIVNEVIQEEQLEADKAPGSSDHDPDILTSPKPSTAFALETISELQTAEQISKRRSEKANAGSQNQQQPEAVVQAGKKAHRLSMVEMKEQMAVKTRGVAQRYGEFVKITDVQMIVQEMIMPMYGAIKKREEEAIASKNQISILNDELKKQRADTRQCLLLKNLIHDNNKLVKKLENNMGLFDNNIEHLASIMDTKIAKLQAQLDENVSEQQKFFEISSVRNKNYLDLSAQFHKAQCETSDILKEYKKEMNEKMVGQDAKLKKIHQYRDQLDDQVFTYKVEMTAKWEQCTQEILEKLEVQEIRMQEIEMQHLKLLEFQKKFIEFQTKVAEMMRKIESFKEVPKLIESRLPLLIHFQICEALHKTLNDITPSKVREFELGKLDELWEFNTQYAGAEPNLKALSSKLRVKAKEFHKQNNCVLPFIFGRDYKPDMMHDEANTITTKEKLAYSLLQKLYNTDSILEHTITKLKEIQQEKTLSNEDCGNEFATIMTRPQIIQNFDYGDEYDDEYYGAEDDAYHSYNQVGQDVVGKRNPLQNERLKQSAQVHNYQRGPTTAGAIRNMPHQAPRMGSKQSSSNVRRSMRMSNESGGGSKSQVHTNGGRTRVQTSGQGFQRQASIKSNQSNNQQQTYVAGAGKFNRTQQFSPMRAQMSGQESSENTSAVGVGRGRGRKSIKVGRGGHGPIRQVFNTIQLVQKPTRAHRRQLELTIRDLKRRGFNLYQKCKEETSAMFDEIRERTETIKKEQLEALKLQDRKMKSRVETRLAEIQDDFLKKTEAAAEEIFEKNHKIVFGQLDQSNKRVNAIEEYHVQMKAMYDVLFKQNNEAIVLHKHVEKIFKEESESFFQERNRWKTDSQHLIEQQDRQIQSVVLSQKQIANSIRVTTDSMAILVDCAIMGHMVQANITNDMQRVNLMAAKPEHNLLFEDRKSPTKKQRATPDDLEQLNDEPVLDVSSVIDRTSTDKRNQSRFLKLVKQACLEFKCSPIQYNNNLFKQKQIIDLNKELLLQIQSTLGNSGIYQKDPFFRCHEGKQFYVRPLTDLATFTQNSSQAALGEKRGTTATPAKTSVMDLDSPSQVNIFNSRSNGRKIIRVPSPLPQHLAYERQSQHNGSSPEDFMRSEASNHENNTTFSDVLQQRFASTINSQLQAQGESEKHNVNRSRTSMQKQASTTTPKSRSQIQNRKHQTAQEIGIVQNFLEDQLRLPSQMEKKILQMQQQTKPATAGGSRQHNSINQGKQSTPAGVVRIASAASHAAAPYGAKMTHYDSASRAGATNYQVTSKLRSRQFQTQSALHGHSATNATTNANAHVTRHNGTAGCDLASTPMIGEHQSMTLPASSVLSHQGPLSTVSPKTKVQRMNQELAKQQMLQNRMTLHNAIHSNEELAGGKHKRAASTNSAFIEHHNQSMPMVHTFIHHHQVPTGGQEEYSREAGSNGGRGQMKSNSIGSAKICPIESLSQRPASQSKNLAVQLRLEVAANQQQNQDQRMDGSATGQTTTHQTQNVRHKVNDYNSNTCIQIEAEQQSSSNTMFGFKRTQTKLMDAVDERLDTSSSANQAKMSSQTNSRRNQNAKEEPEIQTPISAESGNMQTKYGFKVGGPPQSKTKSLFSP